MSRCFCGCGDRAVHNHHVIYRQELRRRAEYKQAILLGRDPRNLVSVAFLCHGQHHARREPYRLGVLPDSVFEFAAELLGHGGAYEYLSRRYAGEDARLDALLAAAPGSM